MSHDYWMNRCLELAAKGAGLTSPNPMVGCVIVYNNQVIGEGYHFKAGLAHAEVLAIQQVKNQDLLPYSTLYVNLEPCVHFGKTPPCTNLIMEKKIPKVVIGALDTHSKVAGKGVEKLKENGVEVITNILTKECLTLNKHFYEVHNQKKPYIYLKYAQSKFGKIGKLNGKSIPLTNVFTNQIMHQLRYEIDAILIGKNTYVNDHPQLNCRWITSNNPKKIIFTSGENWDWITPEIKLNNWIIFSYKPSPENLNLKNFVISPQNWQKDFSNICIQLDIQSILVEGGEKILNSFISTEFYNEIWQIQTPNELNEGVDGPKLPENLNPIQSFKILEDSLNLFKR